MSQQFYVVNKKYNSIVFHLRKWVNKKYNLHFTGHHVYRIIYLKGINSACVDRCLQTEYNKRKRKSPNWQLIGVLPIDESKPYKADIFTIIEGKIG